MENIASFVGANNINSVLNKSHTFELTLSSLNDSRMNSMNFSVYLSDGLSPPFNMNGIESCQIV